MEDIWHAASKRFENYCFRIKYRRYKILSIQGVSSVYKACHVASSHGKGVEITADLTIPLGMVGASLG